MKNILGIIPARQGSKRMPGKNKKLLNGKPLITYSFASAKESLLLNKIIVSTNDLDIISIAEEHGIEVPFVRPEKYADDYATDFDWIKHAVYELENTGSIIDYIVILRPTCPLRTAKDIDNAITTICKIGTDSVRSLTKVKHHPYWMKKITNELAVPYLELDNAEEKIRSQDLPPLYYINGMVDIISKNNITNNHLYGKKMGYILIDEKRTVDIDTPADFEYCKYLLTRL